MALIITEGADLIRQERNRQMTEEGWAVEHDDMHAAGELAMAAMCYAESPYDRITEGDARTPVGWPWEPDDWKPTPDDRVRELVKAGALIAAEIDRLLRERDS